MSNNYLIYSSQRSGSSFLERVLEDHPQVLCAGAIFKKTKSQREKYPELVVDYAALKRSKMYKLFSKRITSKHLDRVFNFEDVYSRGFRLMTNQARTFKNVLPECKKRNTKVIILIRKNIVRQAISLTIAQNAGHWVKNEDTGHSKINLDLQRFEKNINYFQNSRSVLESVEWSVNPLVIYFEDLAGDNGSECIKRVYNYLNVLPEYQPKVSPIKKARYALEDRIFNYNEIINYVKSIGLESLITDE